MLTDDPKSNAHVAPFLYFPTLDGLRFAAFLTVFLHHLPLVENRVLRGIQGIGWIGVHIFLFLSAYLLTSILSKEFKTTGAISIGRFYLRRGLRIWPLYYAFCFAVIAWVFFQGKWTAEHTVRMWGLLAFVDNILSGSRSFNMFPWSPHLWTISLEEQFYLLLPWLLAIWLGRPRRLIWGILVLWCINVFARCVAVMVKAKHPWIWTSVFSTDALLLGTLLGALGYLQLRNRVVQILLFAASVAALLSTGLMPSITQIGVHQVLIYVLVALGAAGLCLVALSAPWLGFLGTRPFRYLGKISYGLYVFHVAGISIGQFTSRKLENTAWALLFVTSLAATVIMAAVSYQILEKPFLALKRRFEAVRSRPL